MAMNTVTRRKAGEPHEATSRGFALLVAVIFMSVMLTFGLALGSLAYKQSKLTETTVESQYAFYAADSALECVLYADQQLDAFDYAKYNSGHSSSIPSIACDGNNNPQQVTVLSYTGTQLVEADRLSLDSGARCADVTIYKPKSSTGTTYLFSQGYNVPCSDVGSSATVARGLEAHY